MSNANLKRILVLCEFYLPGYKAGGALRTLANMVNRLGAEYEFWVVTRDRDTGDGSSYKDIVVDKWNQIGNARVFYTSPNMSYLKQLIDICRELRPEILYINSFFSPWYSIVVMILNRFGLLSDVIVIVAPEGEFSEGALSLKRRKKSLYIAVARILGLYNRVLWKAASDIEAVDIARIFGTGARTMVVPNMPERLDIPALRLDYYKEPGYVKAVFLSRTSPKKNLNYVFDMLMAVKGKVHLDIFGVIDDPAYWESCKAKIACLPANVEVLHHGAIMPSSVLDTLSQYDVFVLPTLGENFGHAILESMLAGCPVLISDMTPWRNLTEIKAGWDLPLSDSTAFANALQNIINMDNSEISAWRLGARSYASNFVAGDVIMKRHRELLNVDDGDGDIVQA